MFATRVLRPNRRLWAAAIAATGAALILGTAAYAATATATATVVQTNPGTAGGPADCTPLVGLPVPGFTVTGEEFSGPFTDVGGKSREAKLLSKSAVSVLQDATICLVSEPDAAGNVNFVGQVGGVATISRQDKSGKNLLTAVYGAPVAGQLNVVSGALSVQWLTGGTYTITDVSGRFAKSFDVGESNQATAVASRPDGLSPETGVLQITFDFDGIRNNGRGNGNDADSRDERDS